MKKIIEQIKPFWSKYDSVSENDMILLESDFTHCLPEEMRDFFLWSNGGAGKFQNIYISLWPLEDIKELNDGYLINHYLGEQFMAFGSDGGPICFLLDYRNPENIRISSVNFGDLDIDQVKEIANSFDVFLELAINGQIISNDL
ncbi:SMI1/KNR4 family protein [Escherichia albertii]|uniref:SMI1/KNR4 family protein n=1 Tax=Escherichia albertii TaxID=208962 RepID=UPI000F5EEE78|nr:SMI1/KNR4 family protein [Escherichia albertii]MCZ9033843.1 SMI1/KNR4 family protein [Escherichia albertii]WDC21532.1 SMI1/KNR4 family protein [Escherichia albertii]